MWNKKNTDLIEEMQNAPYNVLQELQANTISGLASSKKIKGWKGLEAGLGLVSQITGSMSNSVRTNSGTKTTDSPIQGAIVDSPIEVAEPAYDWKMSMPMLDPILTCDLGALVGSSDGDYQTVLADKDEGYIDPNMEGFNYNQLPEGIGDHDVPFLLPEGAQVFSNNPFGFADANKARAKQLERYDKIQAENNDRIMRATIERLEVVNKKLAQNDMEMQELYKKAVSQSKRADKLEAENKQIKDYMAQAQEQENLAAKIKNKKQRRLAREQQEEQENQAMAQLPEIGLEEEEQEGQPQSFTFGGIAGTPIEVAEPADDIWKMSMPMLNTILTTPTANMSTPPPTDMQDIDIYKMLQSVLKEQTDLAPIKVAEPAYNITKTSKPMLNTILTTSAANVSTPPPTSMQDIEIYKMLQSVLKGQTSLAPTPPTANMSTPPPHQNLDGTGERKATKVDAKENPVEEAPPKQSQREDSYNKFKAGQIGAMKNTMGDAALIAGTLFTSLANRRNTDRQQQATLPNVNVYAGIQGYNDMLYQRQLQDIERQQNLQNQSIKSNLTAQLNTNKNNTRSSSVQRVLDATVYGQANKAHQQTSIQASQLRNRLDAQKQQMDMKADVYYRQGEAARRLADQQDMDNYYGQIAKDNTGMGETITRAASLINERSNQQRQQDYFTNSMLQQYGYAATEGGVLVKNKETGEITFQPFETK